MDFSRYLAREWKPALGCTEPASAAYAAALAAGASTGAVRSVHLVCDPRLYKNCYAVGIPHTEHRTGILWALSIGAHLPDASAELECFRGVTPGILDAAARLIDAGAVTVHVDDARDTLLVDCRVSRSDGEGRAVIEGSHTHVVSVEGHGEALPLPASAAAQGALADEHALAAWLGRLDFDDLISHVRAVTPADRARLREGVALNLAIARHGLSLFPETFTTLMGNDPMTRSSRLVCAGVHARMSGEDYTVMTLAGSGNKGITVSVPIALWGQEQGLDDAQVEEALALACLITSQTTRRLGTLSAVCGCANAAGIGLAAGLVLLQGGGAEQMAFAVNNMVGNLTGVICDGAKIGCGLKTMTSVDAAFRASSLALAGIGIPATDGILSDDAAGSLANLERIARHGMRAMDAEILRIMQEKLVSRASARWS